MRDAAHASRTGTGLAISLRPRAVARVLAVCIGTLTAANLIAALLIHQFGVVDRLGILRLFNFNAEANIPTQYQAVSLLACAVLLFAIWHAKRQHRDEFRIYWLVLALGFLYLGVDEGAELHELATAPARLIVEPVGAFRLTWVVLALPAVALFAFAFLRFLGHLSRFYRNAFLLCGAAFMAGALGVEMLGGIYLDSVGEYDGGYALVTTVEELLEKVGVAGFVVTLLAYLRDTVHQVRIGFS